MSITKEEFNLWKKLPVTKAVFKLLEDEIEVIKASLTSERLILDASQGQLRLSCLLGEKKSFETIISLSYEEILDEEDCPLGVSSVDSSSTN
jgi:hypothetical protein